VPVKASTLSIQLDIDYALQRFLHEGLCANQTEFNARVRFDPYGRLIFFLHSKVKPGKMIEFVVDNGTMIKISESGTFE
jgi:hypothetical protein